MELIKMDIKGENVMKIESRLEKLWEDGVREGERKEKDKSKWVLLPISGNEILTCDSGYKRVKRQEMHINITDESMKVLCEKCWEKEQGESKENENRKTN